MSTVSYHCEHEFWKNPEWFSEPLCVFSGLVMCILALFPVVGLENPPLQFCLARASLFVCGFGTAVYHMLDQGVMDETRINGIMLDGVTMALVTVNIFLLHLNAWMKRHLTFISVVCMLYLLFWVFTNDMLTFTFLSNEWKVNGVSMLSVGIQYPSFVVVYVYIVFRVYLIHGICSIYPFWIALFIALCAWSVSMFGCFYFKFLFFGHVVWHICIGYVAAYLMQLGVLNDGEFQLHGDSSKLWLELEIVKKASSGFNCEEGIKWVLHRDSSKLWLELESVKKASSGFKCKLDTSEFLINPSYRGRHMPLHVQPL